MPDPASGRMSGRSALARGAALVAVFGVTFAVGSALGEDDPPVTQHAPAKRAVVTPGALRLDPAPALPELRAVPVKEEPAPAAPAPVPVETPVYVAPEPQVVYETPAPPADTAPAPAEQPASPPPSEPEPEPAAPEPDPAPVPVPTPDPAPSGGSGQYSGP
jgi:hypothetical protein